MRAITESPFGFAVLAGCQAAPMTSGFGDGRRFVARFRKGRSRRRCELRITATFFADPIEQYFRAATMPIPDLDRVRSSQFARTVSLADQDDRALCSALRNFEMVRTAATGEYCIGFHLLHYHGHGHPLFTIWARRCWLRRCYLVFPQAKTGHEIQFRLDFLFYGPLNELLVETSEFDKIIESLTIAESHSPSPDVLPRSDVPEGAFIPIADVVAHMNMEASRCPRYFLPRVLANQSFYLVEMANEAPQQKTQLYQQAIQRLDQALSLRPDHVHAYQEKAYICSRLRDYQQAFAASEEAVRRDPDNPKFRTTWIAIQLDAMMASSLPVPWCRGLDELEREIDLLLADYPEYPSACFEKARLRVINGEPQSAWEACLAEAAKRYRSLREMPSGEMANAKDVVATMIENTLLCCALAQRLGQNR